MKTGLITLLFIMVISTQGLHSLSAQDVRPAGTLPGQNVIPEITSPVNDYANIIPPDVAKSINAMILAHREKTGVQVAVLTVGTTRGMNIEDFSIRTAEQWGGGSKKRDDGLLFTVAVHDRRMRIEVGYGLEGTITDLRAGRILDGIRSDFRNYNYGSGIEKAVKEIIGATSDFRPGQEAPLPSRFWRAFSKIVKLYSLFYLIGALAAVLFILWIMKLDPMLRLSIPSGLFLFIAVPVLFQFFFHGAWYWMPFVYLTGAFAGAAVFAAIKIPKTRTGRIVATVFASIPALVSLASIIYFIEILKPADGTTTGNETALLGILIGTNMLQFFIFAGSTGAFEDGGGSSYSSDRSSSGGSSSYSSSSSSSSSSDNSSYSGGGGSFGGGGASSSW